MTLGERIKSLIEASEYSRTDIAQKINVSKQTLYKYENGIVTNIPSDKIESMSKIFNCSPAYIMGWNTDEEAIEEASFDAKIANDFELKTAIKKYYSLSREKQLLVLNLIDSL